MKLELIATATFGLEAVVRREVENLGCKILKTEDGKVSYIGDERTIVRSNLWLRSADRVLLKMAEFDALEFEALFQQTKGVAWEELIPVDGKFTVTGTSVKSKLHSVPACQSIVKKAIVERLKTFYNVEFFEESGAEYTIKAAILKDRVTLTVDTSGAGLHKRGYRICDVAAPMKETLAAAMVQLSFWKENRILMDPCCGSGTIPIEAAMIGMNIAPGLNRSFASQQWELIHKKLWQEEKKAAFEKINYDAGLQIYGYDIDEKAIEASRQNAAEAGVEDCIIFRKADVKELRATGENGIIITNPPYGQRIGDQEKIRQIYETFYGFFKDHPDWSLFMITTDKNAEDQVMGRKANRRRKLYNGRLETCYYQFYGERK